MTLTRRGMLRRTAVLAAGGLATLGGGCGEPRDTLSRAREVGTLRVGHANEPPFGYVDESGRLTGYSVEVARTVLAGIGIPRVEGVATDFGGLLGDLASGSFDVIAAGMFVTAGRCRRALFATPEYCARQALLVRQGPLERARDLGALAGRDVAVGVLGGSIEIGLARRAGLDREQLLEYPDKEAMVAALRAGEVDVLALTSLSLRRLPADLPRGRFALRTIDVPGGQALCGAAAFRRGDRRLRDTYDSELRRLTAAGGLEPIGRRFGLRPAEIGPGAAASRPRGC